MHLIRLTIRGYRSIHALDTRVGRLTVVSGPNGVGKTNVYNAVRFVAAAARGQLRRSLALEGGMPSALWAGQPPLKPLRIELRVQFEDFGYSLALGLPRVSDVSEDDPNEDKQTMFRLDPQVKQELVWAGPRQTRASLLFERTHSSGFSRDESGRFVPLSGSLDDGESALSQLSDPQRHPELWLLRERICRWRFYHHFDTSPRSAVRAPQVASLTPILSDDASDLAAALQTIIEIGNAGDLHDTIERAFPGHELRITDAGGCRLCVEMQRPGIDRWFSPSELSDGTLRYLGLVAALLSPRPAEFIALNEPETSLHIDLIEPLAELIARAARDSQVWVTTHSAALADALERADARLIRLRLDEGRTVIDGAKAFDAVED